MYDDTKDETSKELSADERYFFIILITVISLIYFSNLQNNIKQSRRHCSKYQRGFRTS